MPAVGEEGFSYWDSFHMTAHHRADTCVLCDLKAQALSPGQRIALKLNVVFHGAPEGVNQNTPCALSVG